MKQIEITIPTNLNEITLGKYQELQSFLVDELDENQIASKMISVLCGITNDEVRGLSKSDYDRISEHLTTILKSEVPWRQKFHIGSVEYGFIPNIDDISFGEYIDLDTFVKKPEDLHKLMTVLYRPIIHNSFGRYEIEKYTGKEDSDIMKEMPMDAVNGSLVFFYRLGNELLKAIPKYLQQEVDKGIQHKKTSEQNGVGTVQSMALQMETLESLMNTLHSDYISASHSYLLKKRNQN